MKYFKSIFSHWSTYATAVMVIIGKVLIFEQPSIDAYLKAHANTVEGILIAAAIAAYHATAPKDQPPIVQ